MGFAGADGRRLLRGDVCFRDGMLNASHPVLYCPVPAYCLVDTHGPGHSCCRSTCTVLSCDCLAAALLTLRYLQYSKGASILRMLQLQMEQTADWTFEIKSKPTAFFRGLNTYLTRRGILAYESAVHSLSRSSRSPCCSSASKSANESANTPELWAAMEDGSGDATISQRMDTWFTGT